MDLKIKFLESKLGLLSLLLFVGLFGWFGTKFDETLLNDGINSYSIIFVESIVLLSIMIVFYIFSLLSKKNLIKDLKKINLKRIFLFYFFSLIGIVFALFLQNALFYHKTLNYNFYEIIVGLIIYVIFSLFMKDKRLSLLQVIILIIIVASLLTFF